MRRRGVGPRAGFRTRLFAAGLAAVALSTGLSREAAAQQPPPNVAATAVSGSQIDITWSASNVGIVTGYRVYYSDGTFLAQVGSQLVEPRRPVVEREWQAKAGADSRHQMVGVLERAELDDHGASNRQQSALLDQCPTTRPWARITQRGRDRDRGRPPRCGS